MDAILFALLLVVGISNYLLTPFIKHNRSAILWFLIALGHIMYTSISFNFVPLDWIFFVGTGIVLMCLMGIFQVKGLVSGAYVCWIGLLIWHIIGTIESPVGIVLIVIGAVWTIVWRKRFLMINSRH